MVTAQFVAYIKKTPTCWIWTGTVSTDGYGHYRNRPAHRVAYELYKGKIPEGLQIDHVCRNVLCVNPDHLETVTLQENLRRAPVRGGPRWRCCILGHEFTPENTYVSPRGLRVCKECRRNRNTHKRS